MTTAVVPRTQGRFSRAVSPADTPPERTRNEGDPLDWDAFAALLPGPRVRHDLRGATAYGAYRKRIAELRPGTGHPAPRDEDLRRIALRVWDSEGGRQATRPTLRHDGVAGDA